MTDNTQNDQDSTSPVAESTENIEIFSTDDEKIKSIGELLTNDSSRKILQILFKEELTATQLAQKTDTSLQLVKYHLNKMQYMGVVKISKIEKNIKAQDMKYYKATKFAIVILPSAVSDKAKESKLLIRSFKTIYRFAGIGIAAVASWFATVTLQEPRQFALRTDNQDAMLAPIKPDTKVTKEVQHGQGISTESSTAGEQVEYEDQSYQLAEEQEDFSDASQSGQEWSTTTGSVDLDREVYPVPFSEDADKTLEESLELAQRTAEPTAGSGTPITLPDVAIPDVFLQFLVPLVVIAVGLTIELYILSKRKKLRQWRQTS